MSGGSDAVSGAVSVLIEMASRLIRSDLARGGPTLMFCGGAVVSLGMRRVVARGMSSVDGEEDNAARKAKIYTKTGDKGSSLLYNGERRKKTDQVFHALGEQDELCAAIGIAREYCNLSENGLSSQLIEIQSRLFDLGAAVATPTTSRTSEDKKQYTALDSDFTVQLERWIDQLDSELPPLTTFIIPSGGFSSTHLHAARVICRRAERAVIPLVETEVVDLEVGRYLNRLSDYLFTAARVAALREGESEVEWRKAAPLKRRGK